MSKLFRKRNWVVFSLLTGRIAYATCTYVKAYRFGYVPGFAITKVTHPVPDDANKKWFANNARDAYKIEDYEPNIPKGLWEKTRPKA